MLRNVLINPRQGPYHAAHYQPGMKHPRSVAELNDIFQMYGAVFTNAWMLEEASGNAIDLAPTGGVNLVPTSSPTQGVSTGFAGGDKGIQVADGTAQRMEAASAGSLDVSTGSVIVLFSGLMNAVSAATTGFGFKGDANAHYVMYTNRTGANGHVIFQAKDQAATVFFATAAADHSGATGFDAIGIIDTASASKTLSLITSLADGGTVDISSRTTFASPAGKFTIGGVSGIHTSAPVTAGFVAIGVTPGTLVVNRAAALARWREWRSA